MAAACKSVTISPSREGSETGVYDVLNVASEQPDLDPPDGAYVRQRWIKRELVDWANAADRILIEHGAVRGRQVYERRHVARWRAQKLINLMVALGIHERWQLAEHTEKRPGGWGWTVEYLGGLNDGRAEAADRAHSGAG